MPTIDDRPLSRDGESGRWPAAVVGAVMIAIPVWLGACALMQDWPPPEAAPANPPAVGPAPPPAPIAAGPIALAPSITGAAAPAPAPVPPVAPPPPPPPLLPAVAVAPPPMRPAPVTAVAPPVPPPTAEIRTFVPMTCPPGAIAMWSQPDAAGTPVQICRRLGPPR